MLLLFFLISFGVVNAYGALDEELLIIACSFIWFDAAAGVFKNFLNDELVSKVHQIKSKFVWFFLSKRDTILDLLKRFKIRLQFVKLNYKFNFQFSKKFISKINSKYFRRNKIRRKSFGNLRMGNTGSSVNFDGTAKYYQKTIGFNYSNDTTVRYDSGLPQWCVFEWCRTVYILFF